MLQVVLGQCIIIPEVLYGAGRHIQDIPEDDFMKAFRLNFVTQPIYLWAICLLKLSIGFFLLRIAVKPIYRRTIIGVMGSFTEHLYIIGTTVDKILGFMAFYTLGCFFVGSLRFACHYQLLTIIIDHRFTVHQPCCSMGQKRCRNLLGTYDPQSAELHERCT